MATVVTRTIGATARQYATLTAWEAFSDINFVSLDEQHEGDAYDDSDFGEQLEFSGATVDATRYRRVHAVDQYDPVADTGCNNVNSIAPLRIVEGYARFQGFRLENTYAGTLTSNVVLFTSGSSNARLERCLIHAETGGGTGPRSRVSEGAGSNHQVWNCIATGDGGTTSTTNRGFESTDSGDDLLNCVAYGIDDASGNGDGIYWSGTVRNCIAMDCGAEDFENAGTSSNNCSSDATATGAAPPTIKSQTATDIFDSPSTNDFTLKVGSNAIDAGIDLSSTFTTDLDGTSRSGLWEMGAYDAGGASVTRRVIVTGG
jgi:hypothetical protein